MYRSTRPGVADPTTVALRLVRLYGPLAVAVFTFLESSMLFPFLPSEVVVPAAAAAIVTDPPSFAAFVAAAGAGGTVGSFVPFLAFRGPGSRWAERFERALRVSEDRADRARRWFLEWGVSSVLWGRFLPGLRSVISIPAGLVGMSTGPFAVLTALGTVGFYASVAGVVVVVRRRSLLAAIRSFAAERPAAFAAVVLAAVGVAVLATVWYRRRTPPPGERDPHP